MRIGIFIASSLVITNAYAVNITNKESGLDDPFFNENFVLDKAISGSTAHQEFIGYHYMSGEYVKRNIKRSEYWLKLAAKNSTTAKTILGELYSKYNGDIKQGVKWYEISASETGRDSAEAKCSYATFMMTNDAYKKYMGDKYRGISVPKINRLIMQSAIGGSPHCTFLYGASLSQKGDEVGGFEYMLKAAKMCHPNAQGVIAENYLFGRGTNRDFAKAYTWYSVAYALGNSMQKNTTNRDKIVAEGLLSNDDIKSADNEVEKTVSMCKKSAL